MVAARVHRHFTAEEYLALERAAHHKSELINGEIYAMAGASWAHGRIALNVATILNRQTVGTPCQPVGSDTRIEIAPTGAFVYPDVTVVCGDPEFRENARPDTLTNPTLIVEVLSEFTEAPDRGDKFAHYQRLESLQEYVLVSQNSPRVERFARQADGQWLLGTATGLDASVRLASVGCDLALAEAYDRVTFVTAGPDAAALDRPAGP